MTADHRVAGTPALRADGIAKVTGAARFTIDLSMPGMAHVIVVRSTRAHARIRGIDREAARASFGVAPDDRLLLVFGGSQAVARITAALEGALERLLVDWRVLHLAGAAGMPAALTMRDRLPETLRERYEPIAFLTDRMADALVASDLVLGRAGSSTCAEVAAVGVASILVPYPHASGHQQANAAWLATQGAAVMVRDAELDGERLLAEAHGLRDDERRAVIGAAARSLARPDAARRLSEELLAMGEGRPLPSLTGTAG